MASIKHMNASPQELFRSVSEYQNIFLESKSKEEIDGIIEKMRDLFNSLPFITIEGKSISGEEIAAFITKYLSLEMIISLDLSPEIIWIKSPFYEIGQIPIAEARPKLT